MPPEITILSHANGSIVSESPFRLWGRAWDTEAGVEGVYLQSPYVDTASMADSSWHLTIRLDDSDAARPEVLLIYAQDSAGNRKDVEFLVQWDRDFLDTVRPVVTVLQPAQDTIGRAHASLLIRVKDTSGIRHVAVNGETVQPQNDSLYATGIRLNDSAHLSNTDVEITAVDASPQHNVSRLVRRFVFDSIAALDTVAPEIKVLCPLYDGAHVYGGSCTVRLEVRDESGVYLVLVNNRNAEMDTGSMWIKDMTLDTSSHLAVTDIEIVAIDKSKNGNADTCHWHAVFDTSDTAVAMPPRREFSLVYDANIGCWMYLPGGWQVFPIESEDYYSVLRKLHGIARPDSRTAAVLLHDTSNVPAMIMIEKFVVNRDSFPSAGDWSRTMLKRHVTPGLLYLDTLHVKQQSLGATEIFAMTGYVGSDGVEGKAGTYVRFVESKDTGYMMTAENDSAEMVPAVEFYRGFLSSVIIPIESVLSSDAHLLDIEISRGIMSPDFCPFESRYDVTVGTEVDEVVITPRPADPVKHLIYIEIEDTEIGGQYPYATIRPDTGSTMVPIRVTAEDGTQMTYEIDIFRRP